MGGGARRKIEVGGEGKGLYKARCNRNEMQDKSRISHEKSRKVEVNSM